MTRQILQGESCGPTFRSCATIAALGLLVLFLASCGVRPSARDAASLHHSIVVTDFGSFQKINSSAGQTVLLSPEIRIPNGWDELVLSWNANARSGAGLHVEARALLPDRPTTFYSLGQWSEEPDLYPRQSIKDQKDQDGEVRTDTLVLRRPAPALQVRLTLAHGQDSGPATITFLGISAINTQRVPTPRPPNRTAWGNEMTIPERSQIGHPGADGWCSPTSVSMVMGYWAGVLKRPELDIGVPQVAQAVHDPVWGGTGNWAFNTAFPGTFDSLRAHAVRLPDLRAIEDLIGLGVPPVASVSSDLLWGGEQDEGNGHLIVCRGFTDNGDVVANDPWTKLDKGESVKRVYPRDVFLRAWQKSHFTVYLIYPPGYLERW